MTKINPMRAWLLALIVWVPSVSFYFWPQVEVGWYDSLHVREEINKSKREAHFLACAASHGVEWFKHKAMHQYQCEAQVSTQCAGDLLCGGEWQVDACIKSKVSGCESLAWQIAGDGTEGYLSDGDFRSKETREKLIFFMERSFSDPLYKGLGWAIIPLAVVPLLPKLGRRLWQWLTTKRTT